MNRLQQKMDLAGTVCGVLGAASCLMAVILRNTDDGKRCVRVEADDQDTAFSGQVLETYPGDSIAGFGSGNEDNQPIQFTDRHIHIVPHLP